MFEEFLFSLPTADNIICTVATIFCQGQTSHMKKKEEIRLSPMTKAHTPTEMSLGQSDNTNNATKKFDYTAVADQYGQLE